MTDALMTPKEYVEAARVLAKEVLRSRQFPPPSVATINLARKVLSQTPRGIAKQARADSKRRNAGVG